MIKKMLLVIYLIFGLAPQMHASHCQVMHDEIEGLYYHEQTSLRSTIQKYLSSVIPGILVGANVGGFCAIFDHLFPPLWPIFWAGSYIQRTKLVNAISDDYKKRHVLHDKVLMELCSLVTTWIAHYKIYQAVHGRPPY